MRFSEQNLSFPYSYAGCHLAGPVLSSCRARGHNCSTPVPAAVPGAGQPSQGDTAPASTGVKGPLGRNSLWQAWPQLPLWNHWPTLCRATRDAWTWSEQPVRGYADIFLWLVLLDPFCARAERWKNSCWEERESDCRWWGASTGAESRTNPVQLEGMKYYSGEMEEKRKGATWVSACLSWWTTVIINKAFQLLQ